MFATFLKFIYYLSAYDIYFVSSEAHRIPTRPNTTPIGPRQCPIGSGFMESSYLFLRIIWVSNRFQLNIRWELCESNTCHVVNSTVSNAFPIGTCLEIVESTEMCWILWNLGPIGNWLGPMGEKQQRKRTNKSGKTTKRTNKKNKQFFI